MRKFGFYPQLALRSLRLNGMFYLPYLLSGMVSAAMLYDILFLNMNRGIYALKGVNAVQGLLGFGLLWLPSSPSPSSATPTASS